MFLKKKPKPDFLYYLGWYISKIAEVIFIASIITFFSYLFLESFKTGLISNYFDLNYLLVSGLLSGLIIILTNEQRNRPREKNKFKISYLIMISLLATVLVYQYLQNLNLMSYFISLLTGLATFISLYLFTNHWPEDD